MPERGKREKTEALKKYKVNVTIEELVGNHPAEFVEYMKYCRVLKYEQDPDYDFLYKLFSGCLSRQNHIERNTTSPIALVRQLTEKEKWMQSMRSFTMSPKMLSPKVSKEVSYDNSPQQKIEEEEKLVKPKARYTSNLIGSLIEEEPYFNNQDRRFVEEAAKKKIDRKLSQE